MNYPENYPAKIDCVTRIFASKGQVIRLNFETINIEHHADCTYDYLEVGSLIKKEWVGRENRVYFTLFKASLQIVANIQIADKISGN